jgi:hypothetical protein
MLLFAAIAIYNIGSPDFSLLSSRFTRIFWASIGYSAGWKLPEV